MKKKILLTSILLILSIFFVSTFTKNNVNAEDMKGYRIEEVLNDKFNKDELDSSWTMNNASLKLDYYGIHCTSPLVFGSGVVLNSFRLGGYKRIEFTIIPMIANETSNISFNFGLNSPQTNMTVEDDVDFKIMLWDKQIAFLDYQNSLELPQGDITPNLRGEYNQLFTSLEKTKVVIVSEQTAPTTVRYYVELYRKGEKIFSSESNPFYHNNAKNTNGYSGFFWDSVEMDVTDFKVYDSKESTTPIFTEDFSNNPLTYSSTDASRGTLHINNTITELQCFISKVQSVDFNSNNSSLINSNRLYETSLVTNPYQLKTKIKFNELNKDSYFGIALGLSNKDSNLDEKNYIGFTKLDENFAEVSVIRNGVKDTNNRFNIPLSQLVDSKYHDVKLTVNSNKTVSLEIDSYKFTLNNISYNGLFAFGNISSSNISKAELNEVSLLSNKYQDYLSKDVSNNFNGIKESDDGFDEPYINSQKYYLGPKVKLLEDWSSFGAKLTFSAATAYSSFGYREKYNEFIMEFDAEILSRGSYNYFGISFARESMVDMLSQSSQTNNSFLFRCTFDNDRNVVTDHVLYGNEIKFSNGQISEPAQINLFNAQENKYHFMFIAKNRSLSVYYAKVGASESELSILRSYVENINIDGFATICATNNMSMNISNFKMTNLNDNYFENSNLASRSDFSVTPVGFNLSNGASVNNGVLNLNNGSISTKEESLYELIRFTVTDATSDYKVKLSKTKEIIFKLNENKIVISEDGQEKAYDASSLNIKNSKNKRFEILVQGNSIKIGGRGNYDPADKLGEYFINHTLVSPLEKDNVSIEGNNLSIDNLQVFYLDNSKEAQTVDFTDDRDDLDQWKVKDDFDSSKVFDPNKETNTKGCKNSILSMSAVTLLLSLSALVIYRKKEEK